MSVEIITKEDLQEFRKLLLDDIKALLTNKEQPIKKWLKTPEVLKLLNISKPTLQNLRTSGKVPFRKIGGVCYYSMKDLEKLLS